MGKAKSPTASKSPAAKAVAKTKPAVAPPASAEATAALSLAPIDPKPRAIPTPPANLDSLVKRVAWPAMQTLHRIHRDQFQADQFNPGPNGNARFSPILDEHGTSIATIYGGATFECAVMETVFHDVPHAPGLKTVAKRKLKQHRHSLLVASMDITLADLGSTALRKLGIPRVDLIDSDKDIYPQTRQWAEAIHVQCADVQGLSWVSRQDDGARAIILFKNRLPDDALTIVGMSVDIVTDPDTYAALIELAETIGVKVTGK